MSRKDTFPSITAKQLEQDDGYRAGAIYDASGLVSSLGHVVTGKTTAAFTLHNGQGIALEQHHFYQRDYRFLLIVTNQMGRAVVFKGPDLGENEAHTPKVLNY